MSGGSEQMAGGTLARRDLAQGGAFERAALDRQRTAVVKPAARWWVAGIWDVALDRQRPARLVHSWNRHRRDQRLGVGVIGRLNHAARGTVLDDPCEVHDHG